MRHHWVRGSDDTMNRIRELREAVGLSAEELAVRVNTSPQQIGRLENGARRLTVDWMHAIAAALECSPADLIANVIVGDAKDEVEPAVIDGGITNAIAKKGLKLYRVVHSSLSEIDVNAGDLLTIDESSDAIATINDASVVLVQMADPQILVLRQYLRPGLLVTNRPGVNVAVRTNDRSVALSIRGVVIRD